MLSQVLFEDGARTLVWHPPQMTYDQIADGAREIYSHFGFLCPTYVCCLEDKEEKQVRRKKKHPSRRLPLRLVVLMGRGCKVERPTMPRAEENLHPICDKRDDVDFSKVDVSDIDVAGLRAPQTVVEKQKLRRTQGINLTSVLCFSCRYICALKDQCHVDCTGWEPCTSKISTVIQQACLRQDQGEHLLVVSSHGQA